MESPGSQNPWTPNYSSRDCSLGVCSIYCPQFCYLIFPPPPPDDSGTPFSPLIIAVIGVLVSASLLIGYYAVVTRFCRSRTDQTTQLPGGNQIQGAPAEPGPDQWPVVSAGLDEALIKRITVCKYEKGGGVIEGTDCAVCLSEFQEKESLRVLPRCSHAFHIPCIDTWLKSQSNCPLCRANIAHQLPPPVSGGPQTSAAPYQFRPPEEDLVIIASDDNLVAENTEVFHSGDGLMSSSVSTGTILQPKRVLISDIVNFEEYYYTQGEEGSSRGLDETNIINWGSRKREFALVMSPVAVAGLDETNIINFLCCRKKTCFRWYWYWYWYW